MAISEKPFDPTGADTIVILQHSFVDIVGDDYDRLNASLLIKCLQRTRIVLPPKTTVFVDLRMKMRNGLIGLDDIKYFLQEGYKTDNTHLQTTENKPNRTMLSGKDSPVKKVIESDRKLELDVVQAKPPRDIMKPGKKEGYFHRLAVSKPYLDRSDSPVSIVLIKDIPSKKEIMRSSKDQMTDQILRQLKHIARLQKQLKQLNDEVSTLKNDQMPLTLSAHLDINYSKDIVSDAIQPFADLIRSQISRPCHTCGQKHLRQNFPWDPHDILNWKPKRKRPSWPYSQNKKIVDRNRNELLYKRKAVSQDTQVLKKAALDSRYKLAGNPIDTENSNNTKFGHRSYMPTIEHGRKINYIREAQSIDKREATNKLSRNQKSSF